MATGGDREVTWKFRGQNELSGPALDAASALQKLRDKIADDTKALRDLNAQMSNLKIGKKLQGDNLVSLESFKTLKKAIDDRKLAISNAQQAIVQQGGHIAQAIPKRGIAQFEELAAAATKAGGPVGKLGSTFQWLMGFLKTPLGMFVAIAAAIAAVTAATVKLIHTINDYATAQANARRTELLRLEGLGRMRTIMSRMLGAKDQSGTEMQGIIDRLASKWGIARGQLVGYATQLHNAHLRGQNFAAGMEGMAMKFRAQGEAGAQQFAQWATYYNYAGRSVQKYADRVRTDIGGIAKLALLDADVQAQKLDASLAAIGAGIDVEPYLRAKAAFNDIFDVSTASGEYLRTLWGRIAQPLSNFSTWAWTTLRTLFLNVILLAMKVELAFRQAFNSILRLMINSGLAHFWNQAAKNIRYVWAALGLVASLAAKGIKWAWLYGLGIALTSVAAALFIIAIPIVLALVTIGLLIRGVVKLYEVWKKTQWVDLGTSMMHGLLRGIASFLTTAINATRKLGVSIWNALKSTLKASSPSRLFAELGTTIPLGVALGITSATPAATQAMDRSGQAVIAAGQQSLAPSAPKLPASTLAQPQSAGGKGGGKAVTVNVGGITVTASSGDNAKAIAADIGGELTRVLEALAIQLGGGADGST